MPVPGDATFGRGILSQEALGRATMPVAAPYTAPPMSRPGLKVELCFDNPFAASPTWTDVTSDVEFQDGVSWSRGRSTPLDGPQPGVAQVTFNNSSGNYTPTNASGAHYQHLRLNNGLRITALWNSSSYIVFSGFVDGWPTAFENAAWAKSTVTATDRSKVLARKRLRNFYAQELATDNPAALYMMDEAAGGSVCGNNIDNGSGWPSTLHVVDTGTPHSLGVPGPFAGRTALRLIRTSDGTHGSGFYSLPAFTAWPFTVEMWVNIQPLPEPHAVSCLWEMQGQSGAAFPGCGIYQVFNNYLQISFALPARDANGQYTCMGNEVYAQTSDADYTNGWHHIVGIFRQHSATLWVDDILRVTATTGSGNSYLGDSNSVAGIGRGVSLGENFFAGMDVAAAAFYPGVELTSGQIAQHWSIGRYLGAGELSGTRMNRVLDWAETPTTAQTYAHQITRSVDSGNSRMGTQETEGVTAWDALTKVVEAEQGVFWFDGSGAARFKSRDKLWAPALAFTLTGAQLGTEFSIVDDDTLLINECQATLSSGLTYTARDFPSQDKYGVYSDSVPDVPIIDEALQGFAIYLVSRYKDPSPRTYTVTISLVLYTVLADALLAADLGQRFKITGLRFPMPSTLDLIIEHLQHDMDADNAKVTLIGSPVDVTKYMLVDNANTVLNVAQVAW